MQSYHAPQATTNELQPPPKCKLVDFPFNKADTWVIEIKNGMEYYNTLKLFCFNQLSTGANSVSMITTSSDELYAVISRTEQHEVTKQGDMIRRELVKLQKSNIPKISIEYATEHIFVYPFTRQYQRYFGWGDVLLKKKRY